MGDPSGIGPEIIAASLADPSVVSSCSPLLFGDRGVMERALKVTGAPLLLETVEDLPPEEPAPGTVYLREVSRLESADAAYGSPTRAAGDAAYRYICEATALCLAGRGAALVTAPISKESMNAAGHSFPGHTELLAHLCGTPEVVMMLAGDKLRVTLVTIHEPLSKVPSLITVDRVLTTIRITHQALTRYFRPNPRLAVLALNPHCGEGGLFGNEERTVLVPAISAARREGIDAHGPLSADTLFHFAVQGGYDAVVCMYHDQGLIPLKLLHFDDGVNVTLGLPIIRTSVDHGTAYDLAGTGRGSAASMKQALRTALGMAGAAAGDRATGAAS
ncbi:4-hydroxythreonine-4-phosphate dehydrogenase PdxA [Geomonas sp. RF6]|uniref:4-hydroxythreonine-4-phosphate dehydrogenase PdxA n=1 Tax=Geomonas sp. RF6 TaxID=2897342 RepID=UPI001E4F968D|nr:4-hydroxythreonine-4-phosphate dehydrogenase PdxA [Geomonas sp. RF6]UFS72789.1 4-hydroxythreonine-4-phosphate dehydrogenase PdxA [Geomonas sp. RF6]